MSAKTLVLTMALVGGVAVAAADTVKAGGKTYENVYVTESDSTYYVCSPEDGTVVNLAKSDVDPKDVTVTQDEDARRALFEQWSEKSRARRGLPSLASSEKDVAAETEAKEPVSPAPSKEKPKRVSAVGEIATQQWYGQQAYAGQAANWSRAQSERDLDARRRQRESAKYRALTERRVITSEDARSSGGLQGGWNAGASSFGNGFGGGGYGGGGYGGGLGNRGW